MTIFEQIELHKKLFAAYLELVVYRKQIQRLYEEAKENDERNESSELEEILSNLGWQAFQLIQEMKEL